MAAPVLKRLNDEILAVMRLPEVREQVARTGAVPAGDSAEAFQAFMAKERQRLQDVITKTGIVLAD